MLRSSLLMALLFAAGAAQAQGVLTEKNISLDLANRLAAETVKQCSAKGYNVSAAVVDRAGVLRALQRADQAGPHTVNASIDKAYTSASARSLTSAMLEGSQKNAGAANLGDIQGFLLLGGGVPVKVGNDTIPNVGACGKGGIVGK